MAHFKPLLHTLRWLQIGIWTLYQVIFELWKLFTWISGQKSFWRSFDSVFFKYNTLTLTSKIALIGQFWSPTTPLKMKKFKKNSKFLGLTLKPSISEKISIVGQKKCFLKNWRLRNTWFEMAFSLKSMPRPSKWSYWLETNVPV